jgi:hypothetical protein
MEDKEAALRKRTQISRANRTMFLWVAGASVVVGGALVSAIFMFQVLLFNERVLVEKGNTVSTLQANNKNIAELQSQVRALDANSSLASVKASPEDQTLQVVLDALPSDANSLALGASLQNKLLAGISGLTITSLRVTPVYGIETNSALSSGDESGEGEIVFQFSVSGNEDSLRSVLDNLERSIRTIHVDHVRIESQGSARVLDVQARAFYEPARVVELRNKTVR